MKSPRPKSSARPAPSRELAKLRVRLAEAEETLHAIRTGGVDTLVVAGRQGTQVFTLQGAEHAYRVLIESMHEGALTLTSQAVILYANQCFARMVKCPLEQVMGASFRSFLSTEDRAALRPLLKGTGQSGSKIQVRLNAGDSSQMPAQISLRALAGNGSSRATLSMVVTDMTEARRNEEMLRALSHRLVQAQESERGRVALELHDNITQLLCAILLRCQALARKLPARDGPVKEEARKLLELLGHAAEEVERISRDLRPSVLEHLGLAVVLRDTGTAFAKRTGVPLKLACAPLAERLPAAIELTLYRILQEALKNVEKHARARQVTVRLTKSAGTVQLTIHDDGIGFDPDRHPTGQKGKAGLGLLGMRERATSVGGVLKVKSARRAGTEIEIRLPVPRDAARS